MRFSVKSDFNKALKEIKGITEKQLPFATALALTNTAKDVKTGLAKEMKDVFDRPTKFTLNSLYIKPAKKRDINISAEVYLKDEVFKGTPASKYLAAQIAGGPRLHKRFEVLLINRGVMSKDEYIMPGQGVKLNAYGNVSPGLIQKVLSNIGAQFDKLQNTTNEKKKGYFVATIGSTRGIWERTSRNLRPVFVIVKSNPTYKKRFNFLGVAQRIVDQEFKKHFDAALNHAIATARL